ncbi:hypothetical protein L3Q82_013373 [Scortum barcoo]|uniref:Uncharacterized protein n=1 Tax=Scortum barcoo TaxID=214431 RepID=A0ACB8VZN5_9TELE|nr:hypothetical protein L3Q82_013373 [Scortum barcoo]
MARHDARKWHDCSKMLGLLCLAASILVHHGRARREGMRERELEAEERKRDGERPEQTKQSQEPQGSWVSVSHPVSRGAVALKSFEERFFIKPSGDQAEDMNAIRRRSQPARHRGRRTQADKPTVFLTSPGRKETADINLSLSPFLLGASGQRVKVEPEVSSYPGQTVNLRCAFTDATGIQLTMVTWIYEPKEGDRINIAVFHPSFDPQLPRLAFKRQSQLLTQSPKPGQSLHQDNQSRHRQHGDGVSSEYVMVPTAADNGNDITCVVAHRTQVKPESFPLLKLAILYAPKVTIVGYDNNWYVGRTNVILTCQAEGNPAPQTAQWKAMSGEMPDTVQVTGNELKVLKVDDAVNTTFICEVKNRIGVGKDQITAMVREPSVNPSNAGVVAGAVIGSLLALLLVAALIAVLVTRSRRQQQGYRANGGSDMKTRIFGGEHITSHQALGEKNNHHQPLTLGGRPEVVATTPTAQDILLSNELDDVERRKFDELEEEERYDHFTGGAPILQLRPPHDQDDMIGDYLDDDMESQRDGSVISRTAVYV